MAITLRKEEKTIAGGEILARMLAAEGVDTVFGIIDGTYFGFYSALERNGIRLVTPRHESSAVHMAGAYARLTGRLGVCMASNGPGVANALPGVAVENAEGNRVLLITSARRVGIGLPDRGGTYQYFPHVDVISPISKFSCSVPSEDRVAEILQKAMRAAWSGRPGVVHVDVPESIMNGAYTPDPRWFRAPSTYRQTAPVEPPPSQIEEAARLLASAKRPALHAGSGVVHAGAYAALRRVSEILHAPIVTSWAARAVVDERYPRAVPMIDIGTVNQARTEADTILILGSRVGETDWWGKPPYWGRPGEQTTIQVDVDPEILGANRPADLAVLGDVGVFLEKLGDALEGRPMALETRDRWMDTLAATRAKGRAKLEKHLADDAAPMNPARVPQICREVFDDDAICILDGGNTAIWGSFFTELRAPGTLLSTPKMGMLGAGVPQTLAAKVACPSRQVYCIIGDGAMGFQPQEIESAVRNDLRVIWLVLCDKQWGMVKMNQQFTLKPLKTLVMKSLGPDETINADLSEIEFDQLARSMGAHGERVADPAGLEGAIRRSIASGKPAVIHVDVDPVKHMWAPALKTFKDMHAEPKG
jgi:acetolactate synthase I/II/III large subunit